MSIKGSGFRGLWRLYSIGLYCDTWPGAFGRLRMGQGGRLSGGTSHVWDSIFIYVYTVPLK